MEHGFESCSFSFDGRAGQSFDANFVNMFAKALMCDASQIGKDISQEHNTA